MDPMKAPAAESPANLRRHTTGVDGIAVVNASEVNWGFCTGDGFSTGLVSTSESDSEFGEVVGVAILNFQMLNPKFCQSKSSKIFLRISFWIIPNCAVKTECHSWKRRRSASILRSHFESWHIFFRQFQKKKSFLSSVLIIFNSKFLKNILNFKQVSICISFSRLNYWSRNLNES